MAKPSRHVLLLNKAGRPGRLRDDRALRLVREGGQREQGPACRSRETAWSVYLGNGGSTGPQIEGLSRNSAEEEEDGRRWWFFNY